MRCKYSGWRRGVVLVSIMVTFRAVLYYFGVSVRRKD